MTGLLDYVYIEAMFFATFVCSVGFWYTVTSTGVTAWMKMAYSSVFLGVAVGTAHLGVDELLARRSTHTTDLLDGDTA